MPRKYYYISTSMLEEHIANITDLHFICGCILYGARKGHYSFDVENEGMVSSMKKEIQAVLLNQQLRDNRYARATVYSIDKKRIAVVIISEASPGESCYEMYAMSVLRSHQNKGYGSQILDSVLDRFLYVDLCARCLPGSDRMKRLLEQRGFKIHSIENDCEVMLKTTIDDHSLAAPAYMSY